MSGWDACAREPNAVLRWIECHPGSAGWAQTVGTFLALLIAIGVPVFAAWLQRRAEREERTRRSKRIVSLLIGEFLVLVLKVTACYRALQTLDWPMFRGPQAAQRLAAVKLSAPVRFGDGSGDRPRRP
jgi:hypothetical protein